MVDDIRLALGFSYLNRHFCGSRRRPRERGRTIRRHAGTRPLSRHYSCGNCIIHL